MESVLSQGMPPARMAQASGSMADRSAAEQAADVNRVGVNRDLDLVGPMPVESRDDTSVVDAVFLEMGGEGLGVAPAVLEEHEIGAGPEADLVFGEVLRRRGGIEGFRADEDEIVWPAGCLI